MQETALPPHVVDGSEITISDLMVSSAGPLKDQDLTQWLDAREKMGFENMAGTQATGIAAVDPETVRTLATKFSGCKDKYKCRGNAITRSCAFTGAFVILKDGRRVLYPQCPGMHRMHVHLFMHVCVCYLCVCVYTYELCYMHAVCALLCV